MAKYRIYKKGENTTIHNELTIEIPISIRIGETITYSGLYKVVDVVHHITSNPIQIISDIHVESIDNKNE